MNRCLNVLFLLFIAVGTVAAEALAAPSDDAALVSKIESIVAETIAQPGGVGLSIAVAREDRMILAKGYGYADLEHGVAMTEKSMLRIGSVAKQYTAALVMKLVEDGALALDDSLTTYVDYPVGEHIVTIRHLLNHTSGIHSYTSVEEFWSIHSSRDLTDDELLSLVRDRPFDFAPGERMLYNNTAYYLLGMVIEAVTGRSYSEALHERLLAPLGLMETRYDVNAEIVPHRARGYTLRDGAVANAKPIGMRNPGAAGGLMATASDLVRWQQALVSGKAVSDEPFAAMIEPTEVADGSTEPYGFGLALGTRHGRECISHGGGIHGFSSMLMYFPVEDLHVSVISNSDAVAATRPAMRIAGAVFGIEEEPLLDSPVPPTMSERIAGTFLIERIDLRIRFWSAGKHLLAQATGQQQFRLMHQGNGVFGALFDPSLRITFPLGEKGEDEPIESFTLEQAGMKFQARRVAE